MYLNIVIAGKILMLW